MKFWCLLLFSLTICSACKNLLSDRKESDRPLKKRKAANSENMVEDDLDFVETFTNLAISKIWPDAGKAIADGRLEDVISMIENGEDLEAAFPFIETGDIYTPLMLAVATHRAKVVRFLLASGAEVNKRSKILGLSPLHLAASLKDFGAEIFELLLEFGADPMITDSQGRTALMLALLSKENDANRTLLATKVCDIYAVDNSGYNAIDYAAENGNLETVITLLQLGLTLSDHNIKKKSLLVDLTAYPECPKEFILDFTKFVAENSPEMLQVKDESGKTALHWACFKGDIELVNFLIGAGLSVLDLDHDGISPQKHFAANTSTDLLPLDSPLRSPSRPIPFEDLGPLVLAANQNDYGSILSCLPREIAAHLLNMLVYNEFGTSESLLQPRTKKALLNLCFEIDQEDPVLPMDVIREIIGWAFQ